MSYGTPPPGGPSDSEDTPPVSPAYGAAPPPPAYGSPPPPPAYGTPPPGYGPSSPYAAAPPPAYGDSPYGVAPGGVGALAQWPQRALGGAIDFIGLSIPFYILSALGGNRGPLYVLGVVYLLGITVWNRYLKGGSTGQTIGRGVAGVRVVSEKTGQPVGALMAFVRDLAHLVDSVICYVGWLFPLWDGKRQTLADKIVGTVSVVAPKA